jgi:hypothetical protein
MLVTFGTTVVFTLYIKLIAYLLHVPLMKTNNESDVNQV